MIKVDDVQKKEDHFVIWFTYFYVTEALEIASARLRVFYYFSLIEDLNDEEHKIEVRQAILDEAKHYISNDIRDNTILKALENYGI